MAGFMTGVSDLFNYAVNSLDMTSSANDVIVVQHADGTLKASPFIVRFGKVKVLRPQDKVVTIEVNGQPTTAVMKIASDGTAYWVHGAGDRDPESPLESPFPQSPVVQPHSPLSNVSTAGATAASTAPPAMSLAESIDDTASRPGTVLSPGEPPSALSGTAGPESTSQQDANATAAAADDNPDEHNRPDGGPVAPPLDVKRLDDADAEELLSTTQTKERVQGILESIAAEAAVTPKQEGCLPPDVKVDVLPLPPPQAAVPSDTGDDSEKTPGGLAGGLRLARLASTDALDQLPLGHVSLREDGVSAGHGDDAAAGERPDGDDASPTTLEPKSPGMGVGDGKKAAEVLRRALYADPNADSLPVTPAAAPADVRPPSNAPSPHGKPTDAVAEGGPAAPPPMDDEAFSESDDEAVAFTATADGVERMAEAIAVPTGRLSADSSVAFTRSVFATHHDLLKLNLKPGANTVRFSTGTTLRGRVDITATIFLWSQSAKLVISDVDGTVTKSDVMGHIATFFGRDWTHPGLCSLYSKIAKNGYHFVYLTARSVSQVEQTRQFLFNVEQDGLRLPHGPVLTAPEKLFSALQQELSKKSHEFKIACLAQLRDAFPLHTKPFYAGFGNRIGDVVAYQASEISEHKIFVINQDSVIHICSVKRSYRDLSHMVDETFPARKQDDDYLQEYYELRQAELAFNAGAVDAQSPTTDGSEPDPDGRVSATSVDVQSLPTGAGERAISPSSDASQRQRSGFGTGSGIPAGEASLGSTAGGNSAVTLARSRAAEVDAQPEFNDFNFWRTDPAALIEPPAPPKAPPARDTSTPVAAEAPAEPQNTKSPQSGSRGGWLTGLWGKRSSAPNPAPPATAAAAAADATPSTTSPTKAKAK